MTELPITKVGLVPFRITASEQVEFLLHKPKPKYNPEDDIPYGLCRGTRRYREDGELIDARAPDTLTQAQIDTLESLSSTALNEGDEELGLTSRAIRRIVDMGPLPYTSLNKAAYPVHWFLAEVKPDAELDTPQDAAGVTWKTLKGAREMAVEKDFKLGYLNVLEKALGLIQEDHTRHHHGHGNCDCTRHHD